MIAPARNKHLMAEILVISKFFWLVQDKGEVEKERSYAVTEYSQYAVIQRYDSNPPFLW
jgi:hypothetical protein